jgi:hypothetical protein
VAGSTEVTHDASSSLRSVSPFQFSNQRKQRHMQKPHNQSRQNSTNEDEGHVCDMKLHKIGRIQKCEESSRIRVGKGSATPTPYNLEKIGITRVKPTPSETK